MKINKIEMYNLNSLKGYWCIDLTSPEYQKNHNQFVIHGETGSGKTTILDAITLALYGKTPRQASRTVDELITKHTNDCMASVTYQCKNGIYKSTFTLKRTNRADGKPQKGFHIVNLETGEDTGNINAYEEMGKETQKRIQLDFDQFCRSIMLAQGKFDTFISGTESQRSEILAKMSGINYKDIGNQIWLKGKSKITQYEQIEKELKDIQLLSDEDEENYINELNGIPAANKEIDKLMEINRAEVLWLEELAKLEKEKNKAVTARENYEKEADEFAENKKFLEKGQNVLKTDGYFQKYNQLKVENDRDVNEAAEKKALIMGLQEAFASAEALAKEAKKACDDHNSKKAENENLWKIVRKLDTEIESENKALSEAEKHMNEAETKLNKTTDRVNEINKENAKNDAVISECDEYIKTHKSDSNLDEIVQSLNNKKEQADGILKSIDELTIELNEDTKKKDEKIILKEDKENLLRLQNNELQKLMSTEYMTISLLLRNKLESGKPCPVCGGTDHPFCSSENRKSDNEKTETVTILKNGSAEASKTAEVSVKVSELGKSIDLLTDEVTLLASEILSLENGIKRIKKDIDKENKVLCSYEEFLNQLLIPWELNISLAESTDGLIEIINLMTEKGEAYKSKITARDNAQKSKAENNKELQGLNVQNLQLEFDARKDEYNKKSFELKQLKDSREQQFGTANVDDAEKSYNLTLDELKKSLDKALDKKQTAKEAKDANSNEINALEKRIAERKQELDSALEAFEIALSKNGFASKEEFEECRCSDEKLAELQNTNERLKREDVSTSQKKAEAEEKYKTCAELKKTEKNREILDAEYDQLKADKSKNDARSGEIKTILENNETKKSSARELQEKLVALKEEAETWDKIRDFIGKRDGENFQVFVEALAFRNLIKKANVYMKMISGKYSLVQVPEMVDFKIHDDNFPDSKEDRSVTNMSGGERFIISLSLALGIAEIASKNVKVDSLFLDEGFGTLSGQPLYESINALKSLQSSGKMLGIITHVNDVINSFDQRIEASPTKRNGGYSKLEGAGITFADKIPVPFYK